MAHYHIQVSRHFDEDTSEPSWEVVESHMLHNFMKALQLQAELFDKYEKQQPRAFITAYTCGTNHFVEDWAVPL